MSCWTRDVFQREELQKFGREVSHNNIKQVALLLHSNEMQKPVCRVTLMPQYGVKSLFFFLHYSVLIKYWEL